MEPKVSVCMITYNHEKFIAQAIESVLMQKTNFDYELVIGEDCSPDRTREIVIDYQKKYPDKIRLLLPEKNLGMIPNFVQTLKACQGKYIALLEGDDYWTDPLKLQKQVDFLDRNSDFSICFHQMEYINEKGISLNEFSMPPILKDFYNLEDLLIYDNFIPTASAIYRRGNFGDIPDWFNKVKYGDWPLHILNALYGKIGFLKEVMSVYRFHSGGVYSSQNNIDNSENRLWMYRYLNKQLNYRYNKIINKRVNKVYLELANEYNISGDLRKSKEFALKYFLHGSSEKKRWVKNSLNLIYIDYKSYFKPLRYIKKKIHPIFRTHFRKRIR